MLKTEPARFRAGHPLYRNVAYCNHVSRLASVDLVEIFLFFLVPAAPISRFQTPESQPYKLLGRTFSALLATVGEPDIKEEMGSPGGGIARGGGFRNRRRLALQEDDNCVGQVLLLLVGGAPTEETKQLETESLSGALRQFQTASM
jgi:hypothetical protein